MLDKLNADVSRDVARQVLAPVMYDKLPSVSADFMPENKAVYHGMEPGQNYTPTGSADEQMERTFERNRPAAGPTTEQRRNYNRMAMREKMKAAADGSLRYAGAIQSGLATLATALKRPDDTLQNGYNRIAKSIPLPQVTYRPQFVRTRYTPQDVALALDRQQAAAAANRRAATNSDLGPSVAAYIAAQNASNNYNAGQALAQTRLANEAARLQNANYINQIEQQNANGLMDAAKTNANYLMNRAKSANTYRAAALQAYDAERSARANAISANSTQLANNLSKIGNENFIFNQIAANPYLLYKYLQEHNGDFGYVGNEQ